MLYNDPRVAHLPVNGRIIDGTNEIGEEQLARTPEYEGFTTTVLVAVAPEGEQPEDVDHTHWKQVPRDCLVWSTDQACWIYDGWQY